MPSVAADARRSSLRHVRATGTAWSSTIARGSAAVRGKDRTVRLVGRADAASSVIERSGRAMSFMGISLPSGRPGVVSPRATFRLHQRAQTTFIDARRMLRTRGGVHLVA